MAQLNITRNRMIFYHVYPITHIANNIISKTLTYYTLVLNNNFCTFE